VKRDTKLKFDKILKNNTVNKTIEKNQNYTLDNLDGLIINTKFISSISLEKSLSQLQFSNDIIRLATKVDIFRNNIKLNKNTENFFVKNEINFSEYNKTHSNNNINELLINKLYFLIHTLASDLNLDKEKKEMLNFDYFIHNVNFSDHPTLTKYLLDVFDDNSFILKIFKTIHQNLVGRIAVILKTIFNSYNLKFKDFRGGWFVEIKYDQNEIKDELVNEEIKTETKEELIMENSSYIENIILKEDIKDNSFINSFISNPDEIIEEDKSNETSEMKTIESNETSEKKINESNEKENKNNESNEKENIKNEENKYIKNLSVTHFRKEEVCSVDSNEELFLMEWKIVCYYNDINLNLESVHVNLIKLVFDEKKTSNKKFNSHLDCVKKIFNFQNKN
jgi:hypothetical protein